MSKQIHQQSLDNSVIELNESPKKLKHTGSKVKLSPLKSEPSQLGEPVIVSPQKRNRTQKVLPGYELATFQAAQLYWNKRNYSRSRVDQFGEKYYQTYGVCEDLQKLKEYGLGIYLYLQLIKELLIACIVISVINILPLYTFYIGDGLSSYPESFTLTLAKFTLGNLVYGGQKEYLSVIVADVLTMIVMFGFYIRWRSFHKQIVEESQLNHKILNPTLYALTITGFDKDTPNLQKSLKGYFDSMFHGAYEVEVIYDYKRNFNKFINLEEVIEKVEKEKQILKQTDKSTEQLVELEKELDQKQKEIAQVIQEFEPINAIVHFRNLKAKFAFINLCKKYALVDKLGYKLRRCICCMPGLPQRQKFLNKYDLMIENNNLARPDQINWNNIDISSLSRAARMVISLIIIIITIFITSSLICFCTLYVSSSSSCGNYDEQTTMTTAIETGGQTLYCYCAANFASIFTDTQIQTTCSDLTTQITISNIVQIGASVVSAVSNIILIVVISLVAEYLYKPDSKPKQYSFIFVFVFLSNYINSTLLPLVLNGDINGFVSVNYLRFVSFINFDTVSIFKDFDRDWFAIISPYYTNFFIIGAASPAIQLVVFFFKRRFALFMTRRKCENNDPQHPTIQKQANQTITMFPFDYPTDVAVLCLQFFMCYMYSGLIPLAMIVFTAGLLLGYFCKRYIILNYTIRIPADESLNEKVINLIPFIILVHGLLSVWSHTAEGFFDFDSLFLKISLPGDPGQIATRGLKDIIQLGATALVLVWIIMDWTIIAFCGSLIESCKDQLQLPKTLATLENENYADRVKNSNVLGSYKIAKNPIFGHAYKAYRELNKRIERGDQKGDDNSSMRDQTMHNLVHH